MFENQFKLEREREFGDILNAAFTYLKQNFKPLFRALLFYAVPMALMMGISQGMHLINFNNSIFNSNGIQNPLGMFSIYMFLTYLFMFLSYSFLYGIILEYIKLYKIHNGPHFDFALIGKELMKDLGIILWTTFVVGLLTVLASFLLLIPGIYLGVCFSLVLPIRIIERKSLSDAMNRCFYLIKNNWWKTFLVLFVVSLLVGVMGQVFSLPTAIYQMIITLHSGSSGTLEMNNSILIFFSILASVGSLLLRSILIVSIVLQYFNLVEQKESPDLLNQLETIGGNEA